MARANAKTSSSPVKIDEDPATSADNPRSSITLRWWSVMAAPFGFSSSENTWFMGGPERMNSFVWVGVVGWSVLGPSHAMEGGARLTFACGGKISNSSAFVPKVAAKKDGECGDPPRTPHL